MIINLKVLFGAALFLMSFAVRFGVLAVRATCGVRKARRALTRIQLQGPSKSLRALIVRFERAIAALDVQVLALSPLITRAVSREESRLKRG